LRIIRAMQPSAARGKTAECVAEHSRGIACVRDRGVAKAIARREAARGSRAIAPGCRHPGVGDWADPIVRRGGDRMPGAGSSSPDSPRWRERPSLRVGAWEWRIRGDACELVKRVRRQSLAGDRVERKRI
jgi:hypothetical protein